MTEREKSALEELLAREELAEKKARIYARLLTDTEIVKKIEGVAENHLKRRATIAKFLGRKVEDGGGMSALKEENGDA